jgi:hypothetical protein
MFTLSLAALVIAMVGLTDNTRFLNPADDTRKTSWRDKRRLKPSHWWSQYHERSAHTPEHDAAVPFV